jgi:hypothetical protein
LPFRREERLGRPARARDPLTIIAARVVMLLPVVEQELSRLFGCSRHRSGIVSFGKSLEDAGCQFHDSAAKTFDSGKLALSGVTR